MSSYNQNLTALLSAVRKNSYQDCKNILDNYELILNDNDCMDYKILIEAVRTRNVDIVKSLLNYGFRTVKVSDTNIYNTPLYYAVKNQDIEIVRELLLKGASITDKDYNKDTPLFFAMKKNYGDIIDLMLSMYDIKNINPISIDEIIHFNIACMRNNVQLMQVFIDIGIDINSVIDLEDKECSTFNPLKSAILHQSIEAVELLLKHGANHSFQNLDNFDVLKTPLGLAYNTFLFKALEGKRELSRKGNRIVDLLLNAYQFDKMNSPIDKLGMFYFYLACSRKTVNPEIVEKFIKSGLDINKYVTYGPENLHGNTPLHLSVKHQCWETAKILLKYGANVDCKDRMGSSLLYSVLNSHNHEMIRLIMLKNPEIINEDWEGNTSLHYIFLSELSDNSIIDEVLSTYQGSLKNSTNKSGLSHFHIASTTNNPKAVEKFLQIGVDINQSVKHNAKIYANYTSLHFSALFHRNEIVELLLKNGANVNAIDKKGLTPLFLACQQAYDGNENFIMELMDYVNKKNDALEEKLKIKNEKIQVIQALLRKQSNINGKDKSGRPLLFHACGIDNKGESMDLSIQKTLEEYTIVPKTTSNHLIKLLSQNRKKILQTLIEHKIDINICDRKNNSILHLIATRNDPDEEFIELCRILLNHGAIVDTINKSGETPLCAATKKGSTSLVELFLEFGANSNHAIPETLKTPLHIAAKNCVTNDKELSSGCRTSHHRIMDLLIIKGADIDAKDKLGSPPLFYACETEKTRKALTLLLETGCDVNATDYNGKTALFHAIQIGNATAIQILLNYGADINMCDNKNTGLLKFFLDLLDTFDFVTVDGYIDTFNVLEMHIEKLKLINHFVSKVNLIYCNILKRLFKRLDDPPMDIQDLLEENEDNNELEYDISPFVDYFKEELKKMKATKIHDYCTLYDVIFKTPLQIIGLIIDENSCKHLNYGNLKATFIHYGYILDLKYKKSLSILLS